VDRDSDWTWYGLGPSGVVMGWVNADDSARGYGPTNAVTSLSLTHKGHGPMIDLTERVAEAQLRVCSLLAAVSLSLCRRHGFVSLTTGGHAHTAGD
jgi:hypothetical protein